MNRALFVNISPSKIFLHMLPATFNYFYSLLHHMMPIVYHMILIASHDTGKVSHDTGVTRREGQW